jgi:catechol 2,3-dioxygenase-like lactoylglutathione lyase family enzyme
MAADPFDVLRLPIVPVEPRAEFAAELLDRIRGRRTVGQSSRPASATPAGPPATVRYFVADLAPAIEFYRRRLGFEEEVHAPPNFAMLQRGDLRLLLSVPTTHVLPDGSMPEPGGWNRISLQVADLAATVDDLRAAGVPFRAGITRNPAVQNALVEDPSGNLIELFEPLAAYRERTPTRGGN